MKNLKITIITPSYNQGDYIERTIQSVINQNYPNLEYLIFDGGSTDNSVKIIKKYALKYPHIIQWQSKKDKGQVDAINQGLRRASGDIIAYINSDDYYLPDSFLMVTKYFIKNPNKLWLVGNCLVTQKSLIWTFIFKHLWPVEVHQVFLKIFNTINQPSVFLRSDLVKTIGQFNPQYVYAFDYDYWLRCTRKSLPGRVRQNLSVFTIHQNAKGSTNYRKQFIEDYQIICKYTSNKYIKYIHKKIRKIVNYSYNKLK
jgi:glycosyltransferase involved in cell wall biosynthesis